MNGYDGIFAPLKEAGKNVVGAYQDAARVLDTLQEWIYIETGMVHTAHALHLLAHEMPKRFDKFGEILHQRHLMVIYPATAEFTSPVESVEGALEYVIGALDGILEALEAFRAVCDNAALRPMALAAEERMLEVSEDHTGILEMMTMLRNAESHTGFDNWVEDMEGGFAWVK